MVTRVLNNGLLLNLLRRRRAALPHPPYGPGLDPPYYHFFGALKDAIRGKMFESDDKVIAEVAVITKFKLV
jgi:hypothetical protein